MYKDLSQNQKDKIIDEFENGKTALKVIARKNNLSIEELYSFIESYYEQKGVFPKRMGLAIGKKEAKKEEAELKLRNEYLKKLELILKYAIENEELPESINEKDYSIISVKSFLENKMTDYLKKYEKIKVDDITDDLDREIMVLFKKVILYPNHIQKEDYKKIEEIEEWCKKKGVSPRHQIRCVKEAKSKDKETEQQYEVRLGKDLFSLKKKYLTKIDKNNFNTKIIAKLIYLDKLPTTSQKSILSKLDKVENWCAENGYYPRSSFTKEKNNETESYEEEKKISKILSYLLRRYLPSSKNPYNNKFKPENQTDRDIISRLNKLIQSYPKHNQFEIIKLLDRIEQWCIENKAKPREKIVGVKMPRNKKFSINDLSDEQLEMFLAIKYNTIMKSYMSKYKTLNPEEVQSKIDENILKKIFDISKYETKIRKSRIRKSKHNEVIRQQLDRLAKSKDATPDQIKAIADYYGIEIDDRKSNNFPYDTDGNTPHNYWDESER